MAEMMDTVVADLAAEQDVLDGLVADLDEAGWATATPSEGWNVADQISHLAYFDQKAAQSVTDPEGFAAEVAGLIASEDLWGLEGRIMARGRAMSGSQLLGWWRESRLSLYSAMRGFDPEQQVPWYGPPMKAYSSAQARLMENWAHGQDVADALGVDYPASDRIYHVAELGIKTFSWSFRNRGLAVPDQRVRVVLRGTSGRVWVWNEGCDANITGPLRDFCLVVTQRRHAADTRLVVQGGPARQWMKIAQAYAGPPGPGRPPSGD
ncbi:MAG: TIGR03084 family metal-binding protein [bacterium]|nr:TIGR03084 family metal-binding protein [bacterium]MDE0601895.1 TIGR03084 family metal-binding protein [bacterium]